MVQFVRVEKNKMTPLQFAPIQFVSGKGGVGKSVMAASIALKLSKKNKKVLLVELGERSFYEKFFQTSPVTYKPQKLNENIDLAIWDFKACLKEYVSFYIRSEKLYEIFFGNQIMKKLIEAAPALKELAILGKATSGPRNVGPKIVYDHIVIDSYSMGHHKALLKGPKAISKVIHRGPMGHHSEKINEIIVDPKWTSHFIVMKPEELPTQEGLELYWDLKKDLGVESQILMNMYLEPPIPIEEIKKISLAKNESSDLASFYHQVFQEQKTCLERVQKEIPKVTLIPFNYEIEDKMKFLEFTSEALP